MGPHAKSQNMFPVVSVAAEILQLPRQLRQGRPKKAPIHASASEAECGL